MKRKLVFAASAWFMGLLTASFLPMRYVWTALPIAVGVFLVMRFLLKRSLKEILTVAAVFALAVGYYNVYDLMYRRPVLQLTEGEHSFSGVITDVRDYTGENSRYLVRGEFDGSISGEMYVYAPTADHSPDDRVYFTGTVREFDNDFLFDSRDYYASKGIFLTSHSVSRLEVQYNEGFSLKRILYNYRKSVTDFIKRYLPEDESALLCGMLFGDKSSMSQNDKEMFYNSGIGHVMAVSGLHLVLFCGIFMYLFRLLRIRAVPRFLLIEGVMAVFVMCSGMSVSVLRGAFMLTLTNIAPLFFRRSDSLSSVGAAFILLTLPCPFAVRDPSLLLSVTGVISAGAFAPFMTRNMPQITFVQRRLKDIVYLFFVSLGIFPVSVMCFGESSLVSPLANMLLTPVCMAALALGIFTALTVFLKPVFLVKAAGVLCRAVLWTVRYIGSFDFSGMNFNHEIKWLVGILTLCGVVLLIRTKSRKKLGVFICSAVVTVVCCVGGYKFIDRDNINIAVLGKNRVDVIAAVYKGKTYSTDISGNKNNVRYAKEFLQRYNIHEVECITIMSKAYQGMSLYNKGMGKITVRNVYLPLDTVFRGDEIICGTNPVAADMSSLITEHEDMLVSVRETRVSVEAGEFSFVCDSENNDERVSVFAEYGKVFDPPLCSEVIVPEYAGKAQEGVIKLTNLLITANRDGRYSIETME